MIKIIVDFYELDEMFYPFLPYIAIAIRDRKGVRNKKWKGRKKEEKGRKGERGKN